MLPCTVLPYSFFFSTRASDLSGRICRCDPSNRVTDQCLTSALVLYLVTCLNNQHDLGAHSCPQLGLLPSHEPLTRLSQGRAPALLLSLSLPEAQDAVAGDDGPTTDEMIPVHRINVEDAR